MTIVIALLLFGIIILIHEFGHFLLAKKNGVTIHEFSIGMGPKIYSKEKNGTEYSIRILPIGGYVSMEGEEDGFDRSEEEDDLSEENDSIYESLEIQEDKSKISDEIDGEVAINEGSFAEKTILQRASIIFAGPFFNFLGCIGFLVALFLISIILLFALSIFVLFCISFIFNSSLSFFNFSMSLYFSSDSSPKVYMPRSPVSGLKFIFTKS